MKKIILIAGIFLLTLNSYSQVAKLQSVFIYNFTKYIDWPAAYKTGPFIIGVIGESPIIIELSSMASTKTAGSQKIVIKKFNTVSEITKSHIIFIPQGKSSQLSSVLTQTKSHSTLIITEQEGLAQKGSCINFIIKDNKQKFELNKSNVINRGLQINSALERLAIVVN